jgi:hypothetical protein
VDPADDELPCDDELFPELAPPSDDEVFPELVVPAEEVLPADVELDCLDEDVGLDSSGRLSLPDVPSLGPALVGSSTENFRAASTTSGAAGWSWSPAVPRGRSRTTVVFCCTRTTTKCWMITGAGWTTVTGRRLSSGHVCPV